METIGIIGAGPAGIMAALKANFGESKVLLFDSNAQIGRKLLVTGSGRCNITNLNANPSSYACSNPTQLKPLFDRYSPSNLLKEFRKVGILTYATPDSWCYPVSESAATVVDAFSQALGQTSIELHLNTTITRILDHSDGFRLTSKDSTAFRINKLIIAAGGKAYPTLGSTGTLFPVLQKMGHTVNTVMPALAPLEADLGISQRLRGVRMDVTARLLKKDLVLGETTGNLIVTAWGFNGPAVMNLSHLVSLNEGSDLELELDLLTQNKTDLQQILKEHQGSTSMLRVLLGAALPHKVPPVILNLAGLQPDIRCDRVNAEKMKLVWQMLTALRFKISGTRGFEFCQLKVGGVPLDEIQAEDFQSKKIPGLYLAGEVLDVVGPCGGYNLQFAFASGALAGESLAQS
jgi:predicted Rossmann fold flavoprotein